jgi:O6-methylguanine-DNA--protein-cysteine methyltransferase
VVRCGFRYERFGWAVFGKTRTYLEQAKTLGDVKAIRAVASANGKNPYG